MPNWFRKWRRLNSRGSVNPVQRGVVIICVYWAELALHDAVIVSHEAIGDNGDGSKLGEGQVLGRRSFTRFQVSLGFVRLAREVVLLLVEHGFEYSDFSRFRLSAGHAAKHLGEECICVVGMLS